MPAEYLSAVSSPFSEKRSTVDRSAGNNAGYKHLLLLFPNTSKRMGGNLLAITFCRIAPENCFLVLSSKCIIKDQLSLEIPATSTPNLL